MRPVSSPLSFPSPRNYPRISLTYTNKNEPPPVQIRIESGRNWMQGRQVLNVRDQNSIVVKSSHQRRHSKNINSSKEKRAIGKNIIKPCHKPFSASKLQIQDVYSYLPAQLANSKDTYETLRIVNQKLRQMRLSQSKQPIVQPYRDKSTDSYAQGHAHNRDTFLISAKMQREKHQARPTHEQSNFYHLPNNNNFSVEVSPLHLKHLHEAQPRTPTTPLSLLNDSKIIKEDLEEDLESKEIASPLIQKPINYFESEAQKCGKIKFLYEPYSMNLSSNRNNQTSEKAQPVPILKGYESKVEKIRNNRILQTTKQPQAFEDEDKWDKILRMRQQSYRKAISREQSETQAINQSQYSKTNDQTAINTALKYLPNGTLEELNPYSAHSYQSSNTKQNEKMRNESQLYQEDQNQYSEADPRLSKNTQELEESSSTNRFYHKLQEIAQHYKNNEGQPKEMKYSYSFQENKAVEFRVQKELFSRFLASSQLQWMLMFSQMIAYVQNSYSAFPYSQAHDQDTDTGNMLITYVKIGESGQKIYQNRFIAHYIGIWLLTMGYDDFNVRNRVVQNVELMFTDDDQNQAQLETKPQWGANIRSIAQIMYNNLFHGYLPEPLQLRALLEICKRGWQFMTFLICKVIKVLLKVKKWEAKHGLESIEEDTLYKLLQRALEQL